jgi:DUF4097 and DUF4098 domain-containing protein YvlB
MNTVSKAGSKAILTAVFAGVLAATAWAAPPRSSAEGSFDRTLTVSGPVTLDVRTGSGNISVKRGDTGSVVVHGEIRSSHGNWSGGSDVEQRVRAIEKDPPIEQDGNTIRIGRDRDNDLFKNISVSYEIRVPAATRLQASTGSGDVVANGLQLEIEGRTGSGNIRIENTSGRADLTTGSGDIELRGTHGNARLHSGSGNIRGEDLSGGIEATAGSGDLKFELAGPGDVDATTGSGNITVRGAKGAVRARTGSGNVEARGEQGGEWHLHSSSGNVTVELPPNAGFELNARSSSGNIQTDRTLTVQGTISRREIHAKSGNGGPLLEVSTSSGSIYLR